MMRGTFFLACASLILAQLQLATAWGSCPTWGGNPNKCCCDGGYTTIKFNYIGCNWKDFTPTDNMPKWQRTLEVRGRSVIVENNQWRTKAGNHLSNWYRICNGGDCAVFDLSCNKPFGPGFQVSNWEVASVRTGKANSGHLNAFVGCPPNTRWPWAKSYGGCAAAPNYARVPAPTPAPAPRAPALSSTSNFAAVLSVSTSGSGYGDTWLNAALDEANAIRRRVGQSPHTCDWGLTREASDYADKLCQTNSLSHNGFFDRCKAAGYSSMCAENLLWNMNSGSDAPAKAIVQWKNSNGHYRNMVSSRTEVAGYGYSKCSNGRVMWVALYSA